MLSLYLSVTRKLIYNNTWMYWIRKDSFRAATCFFSYSAHSTEICQIGCGRAACTWKGPPAQPFFCFLPFSACPFASSDCDWRATLPARGWRGRDESLTPWLKRTQQLVTWTPGPLIKLSPSPQWHKKFSLLCSLAVQDLIQISP